MFLVFSAAGAVITAWYLDISPSPDANYQGQDRRGNGERYRPMATTLLHTYRGVREGLESFTVQWKIKIRTWS